MHPSRFLAALALLALAISPAHAGKGGGKGKKHGGHKKVQPHWEGDFFARPEGGVVGWSDGTAAGTVTAASVGGQAGYQYWRVGDPPPQWTGQTRVAGSWILSSGNASGLDARVGSFIGPRWKYVGLQGGPDLFWNRWQYGGVVLDPTVGLAVPITATATLDAVSILGGAEPAWLSNEERRVDWDQTDALGFGHEFTWFAGVGISVQGVSLGVQYRYHIQASGVQQGFSFGAGFRG